MTEPDMVVSEAHFAEPDFIGQEGSEPEPGESPDEPADTYAPGYETEDDSRSMSDDPPIGSIIDIPTAVPDEPNETGRAAESPVSDEPIAKNQGHVSSEQREQLLDKLREVSSGATDGVRPENNSAGQQQLATGEAQSAMPRPKMARRGKGIAYFFRSFIQLGGRPLLREGDEIIVSGRAYELRPKKLETRYVVGGAALALTIILLVVASLIVGGGGTGSGNIVGVVLDEYSQPFLQGAEIYLVDVDRRVTSNSQGFFEFEDLPAGPHEFRLMSGRAVLGHSYATVVGGQTSTLLLSPNLEEDRASRPGDTDGRAEASAARTAEANSNDGISPKSGRQSSGQTSQPRWASLRVHSNVDKPRLSMDGEVLGNGNAKYVKLLPGRHAYQVTADGYAAAKGTIDLPANQITTLAVNLEPISAPDEAAQIADDDYLLGTAAASDGDHQEAVSRFTEVLSVRADHVEALEGRAYSNLSLQNLRAAHDDFLKAGEIRRTSGHVNRAITDYNKAIEIDRNSLRAYLGRGETYLAMSQSFAAVANFDAAMEIDDKSFEAHYGLGRARYQQRQYKRALRHFEDARKLDPQWPGLYRFMMLSHFANDSFDEVQQSYERFVEVASPYERDKLHNNPEFSAVMRVID